MTKLFRGQSHSVWVDTDTTAIAKISIAPTGTINPVDDTCHVSVDLWMGINAATELLTLLGQAIAEYQASIAPKTEDGSVRAE